MYYIGIDLGGTSIKAGVAGRDFSILSAYEMPTPSNAPAETVADAIAEAAYTALEKAGVSRSECRGIGLGSPGSCNREKGLIMNAWNLGWKNVPIRDMLSERMGMECRIANDADCAAFGETLCGAAKGFKDVAMITLGTGYGGGFVINGEIYSGCGNSGTEIGHALFIFDGEECTCGRKGCIECYASGTALIKQGMRAAAAVPSSSLNKYKKLSGKIIFEEADGGDLTATEVVKRYTEYVAAAVTDTVNYFDPQVILIGGGISERGEKLISPIREYVYDHCFGGRDRELPFIRRAALGNKAGLIGAAGLMMDRKEASQ